MLIVFIVFLENEKFGFNKLPMNLPLVSVIIPTFNRSDLLVASLESVLNQSYRSIEVIIVDDCSPQNPEALILGHVRSHKMPVSLIRHAYTKKQSSAINTGLKHAHGEFITILNDDDLFDERKVERQIDVFFKHPEVDVVYSDYMHIDLSGRKFAYSHRKACFLRRARKSTNTFHALLQGNFIDMISPLVRKKAFDQAGGFREGLTSREDWDMWLRISANGSTFYFLDEPLVYIRIHPCNKSKQSGLNRKLFERILYGAIKDASVPVPHRVRERAYAKVFFDYANASYKKPDVFWRYMVWALWLDVSLLNSKTAKRLVLSFLRNVV